MKKEKDQESFDEMKDLDDIIDVDDILIFPDQLEQRLRGNRIDNVGVMQGLGKEMQYEMVKRAEAKKDQGEADFFAKQDAALKKEQASREDAHRLPQKFKPEVELPYKTIDVIFNHENIWSNTQCSDPAKIYYNIHKEKEWLPFIKNPNIPYVKDTDRFKQFEEWI